MNTLFDRTLDVLLENPWAVLFQSLLTILILTRAFTQISPNFRSANFKSGTKAIPRASFWLPVLGNTVSFFFRQQSWLLDTSKRLQSNIFGLKLYGSDYAVVISPLLQAQLSEPSTPVSTKEHLDLRKLRFFSNRYASSGPVSQTSTPAASNPFDVWTTRKLTRLLETHSYNFISPSKSWVDQAQWERSAGIDIVQEKPILSVSGSLTKLTQEFSAHIILSTLLSSSFMEANSGFVADFFTFSSSYSMFMTGLPYWVAPGLGPPALAREKCLLALDGLVDAMLAELKGRSLSGTGAGMLYDLDDVHREIWDIVKQSKSGVANGRQTRKSSCEILETVWNATFPSVNIVLWTLVYLFGQDGENKPVLEQIKTEVQKVAKVVKPKASGLPFEDPPRLQFTEIKEQHDQEKQFPTLHGAILEVLRLETEPEEYFTVQDDFVLTADAAPDPQSIKKPALLSNVVERFQLVKGDRIYAAYGATHKDSYYWDRPRRFAPNRYGLAGGAATTQARLPRTTLTRHFGGISQSLCIIVALLSLYEFEDIKHPGATMIAGVGVPKSSLRANISRRKL